MDFLKSIILIVIIFCNSFLYSQVEDDPEGAIAERETYTKINYKNKSGLMYGLNIGILLANKAPALFYNGSAPNDIFVYLNTPSIYGRIKESLGGYDFTVVELPEEMRYKPATSFGLNLRYQFDWNSALVADINYSLLNTSGQVVVQLDKNDPNNANPFLEYFDIWAKENRMVTSIGYQYTLSQPSAMGAFIEFGPLLTTVKVKKNAFEAGGKSYNILRPQAYTGGQFLNNKQPSVNDLGFYSALGFNVEFDKFTMDILLRASMEKVQFDPELEAKRKIQYYPHIRFSYRIIKP